MRGWNGRYAMRGTIEGSRQATAMLEVEPLTPGAAELEATRTRVRRTYPTYEGPFYRSRLLLVEGADTVRSTLTCAHGPAAAPPLVCQPTSPIRGLEAATLVLQPEGRAVLTGSHGEGVSVEYARLNWTRDGA